MSMRFFLRTRRQFFRDCGVGLSALLAAPTLLPAQGRANNHYGLVILTDGFVLQGMVVREDTAIEEDPITGTPFEYQKGFFQVDDGPRRIVFSQRQVRVVTKVDPPTDDRVDNPVKPFTEGPITGVVDVLKEGPWDLDKADRSLTFLFTKDGKVLQGTVNQHVGTVTPYFTRLDSTEKRPWHSVYLTRELPPELIQRVLGGHPLFQEKPAMTAAQRAAIAFRYADFFIRCGWYEQAQARLTLILKDFPAEKERVVERQKAIARLRSREEVEHLKRLHNAGQYKEVLEHLKTFSKDFPEENVPEDTLAAFRELKAQYDGVDERAKQAIRLLSDLAPQVDPKYRDLFTAAAKAIRDDVYFESLTRLDTFLSQAKQAERQKKAGKTPDLDPSKLVALAVTGFLLGNGAAEANPDVAAKLWRTRQLLDEYLHTTNGSERRKLLADYLAKRNDSTALDDFTRIIPTLPPVEPEDKLDKIGTDTVTMTVGKGGTTYDLKLPPEYRHSRPFPVLIVLHKADEKPADAIAKWADQAAENGYILAAPEWQTKRNQGIYSYGDEGEHEVCLATLRDLRRRFQVDSDRVFLFGQGQGANMAHDVGLSHPDLFAGVSSMGVNPEYYNIGYWRNALFLPFYVVTGTNSGKSEGNVHKLFENWTAQNFPALWVQYKGRGNDWFGGEVPNVFDWMRTKRRAFPLHRLGSDGLGDKFGTEYFTVRATDNSYYWLTTDNLDPDKLIPSPKLWGKSFHDVQAPRMTAVIDPAMNQIRVSGRGMKEITIWLGRNAKGESMIDFDKEVLVRVNGSAPAKKKCEPSESVMLECLYQRGDRQRLFLQKIEIPNLNRLQQ